MVDSFRLYGQAMLDHLGGTPRELLIERDDGYTSRDDLQSLFAPYRSWREDERLAVRFAKGHVLDVGCGPGRVTLYLQRRGFSVTAIDVTPEALECARLRGVRKTILMDALHLQFPRTSFDTFILLGANFGIAGDFAATKQFLRQLGTVARSKARIIASTRTPGSWIEKHARYVMRNVREGRPPGLLRLRMKYKGMTGSWFPLLLLSPDDALRLCQSAGWEVVKVIPSGGGVVDYSFVAEKHT